MQSTLYKFLSITSPPPHLHPTTFINIAKHFSFPFFPQRKGKKRRKSQEMRHLRHCDCTCKIKSSPNMGDEQKYTTQGLEEHTRQGEPQQHQPLAGSSFLRRNTRTTAVFMIKHLRTLGFSVTNDAFAICVGGRASLKTFTKLSPNFLKLSPNFHRKAQKGVKKWTSFSFSFTNFPPTLKNSSGKKDSHTFAPSVETNEVRWRCWFFRATIAPSRPAVPPLDIVRNQQQRSRKGAT